MARRASRPTWNGARAEGRVSDRLEGWLLGDRSKTLGGLVEVFGEKSFAMLFVLLMALPALPLPTGGVTHVLEVVAMLLAIELLVGRRTIWLPRRFARFQLAAASQQRFVMLLLKRIRSLERFSRPRGRALLRGRLSGALFGATVLGLTLTAFLAPPFSGLDTLPSMGVVLTSLGVLLEDVVVVVAGVVTGAVGVALVVALGSLIVDLLQGLS